MFSGTESCRFLVCAHWCLSVFFFFSSRRRHTRFDCDWSSDVCSSDLAFLAAQIGSSTGLASRSYLNNAKVPQLFVSSGSATWLDDAAKFPWSMGWLPLYTEIGRASCRERV